MRIEYDLGDLVGAVNLWGDKIVTTLVNLEGKLMPTLNEMQAAFQAIDTETTRIADAIAALVAKLNSAGLSDAEEVQVKAALDNHIQRLRGIASDPSAPVPPAPTT